MTANIEHTLCNACGSQVNEPSSTLPADRKPCASCGSLTRRFNVCIEEKLTIREKLGMKHKRPGYKKPIYESVSGDDLYRKTGKWNKLTRIIDRENDYYKEVITDPENGEILRHCEEPLTEHFGQGSAKSKKGNEPS